MVRFADGNLQRLRRLRKPFVEILTNGPQRVHSGSHERGYAHAVRGEARVRVLVIGAGGHARVCVEALLDDGTIEPVGAVSEDGRGVPGLGIEVIGRTADALNIAERMSATTFCVAVGDNRARRRISAMLTESGRQLTRAISGSAVLSPTCELGAGVQVLPAAVVNAATAVDTGAIVNTNATVDHDCRIGPFAHVAPGAALGGGVTVGSGALVGIGARVLPGLTVGADATVGGGAVVVGDVDDGATVVGVPARPIGRGAP